MLATINGRIASLLTGISIVKRWSNWSRQVIVSDMTAFKVWYMYIEVTFYFDVFTKEILSYKVAERRGAREQYVDGLNDVFGFLEARLEPGGRHSDR